MSSLQTLDKMSPAPWNFATGFMAVVLLGVFLLQYPTEVTPDGTGYLIGAKFIAKGAGYVSYGVNSQEIIPQIDWPPLYSFLIALGIKLTGLKDLYALRMINFLALCMGYIFFYKLSILFFKDKKFQTTANFLIFISPILWSYVNVALSEPLFSSLFGAAFFFLLRAVSSNTKFKRNGLLFVAGLLTMLLCLTKYSGLFMAISFSLFLLATQRPPRFRERAAGFFLFAAPVLLGAGAWFLRNWFLSRHWSFLETYPSRPLFENFFAVEASFIRNLVEYMLGYSSYKWSPPCLGFIPPLIFLACLLPVLKLLYAERKLFFFDSKGSSFPLLFLLTFAVYVAAMNLVRLKTGFGENSRYFIVLSPVLALFVLFLIRALTQDKISSPGFFKYGSLAILGGFLLLSSFFNSITLLKQIHGIFKGKGTDTVVPGAISTSFENSKWVYELLQTQIKSDDIIISNDHTFLSYAADRPCRGTDSGYGRDAIGFRGFDKPGLALEEVKNTSRQVYLILDKNLPCFLPDKPQWKEYIEGLHFEVIREDAFGIVLRLLEA